MKSKYVIIILTALCAVLAVLLFRANKASDQNRAATVANLTRLSNDLAEVSSKLGEQRQVNVVLETNLIVKVGESGLLSNKVAELAEKLAEAEQSTRVMAESAKAAAELAAKEIAKRDEEITRREKESDDLTRRMGALNVTIGNLEQSIAETQRKLAASEGDRQILMRELKRLQAEKAELERQFTDLAVLREQVRKLREELSISRRIEWIKRGLYGAATQKGGERLQGGPAKPIQNSTNVNLNVEISRQGGAKIVPSDKTATNPPSKSPTPGAAPSPTPKTTLGPPVSEPKK